MVYRKAVLLGGKSAVTAGERHDARHSYTLPPSPRTCSSLSLLRVQKVTTFGQDIFRYHQILRERNPKCV